MLLLFVLVESDEPLRELEAQFELREHGSVVGDLQLVVAVVRLLHQHVLPALVYYAVCPPGNALGHVVQILLFQQFVRRRELDVALLEVGAHSADLAFDEELVVVEQHLVHVPGHGVLDRADDAVDAVVEVAQPDNHVVLLLVAAHEVVVDVAEVLVPAFHLVVTGCQVRTQTHQGSVAYFETDSHAALVADYVRDAGGDAVGLHVGNYGREVDGREHDQVGGAQRKRRHHHVVFAQVVLQHALPFVLGRREDGPCDRPHALLSGDHVDVVVDLLGFQQQVQVSFRQLAVQVPGHCQDP